MRRPRVLVLAEEANPEWVSVPRVGWSHGRALARIADVHLVTQIRNREALQRAGLGEPRDFTAIDSEAVARPLWRLATRLRGGTGGAWTVNTAVRIGAYGYFEHLVWRAFRERLAAGGFDLVHRLTPLSPALPSGLARRCRRLGVPFVIGPLNGGVPWPPGFAREQRREREWLSHLRAAHRWVPGYRATRRDSAAIVVGSQSTWRDLPERYRDKAVYLPENAVEPDAVGPRREPRAPGPLRLAFAGRLVPLKGVDMLLEAAAPLVRRGEARLDVIGDGPCLPDLRDRVARAGIGDGVRLEGWLAHAALPARLRESELFVFPSIREFGGGAVLEAMAQGLVPLVMDYGGPAELVTETSGFKLPMASRAEIVSGLRRLLERLAADPAPLSALGERARERVRTHFTWPVRAGQMLEVYRFALGQRERPDFGMPLAAL